MTALVIVFYRVIWLQVNNEYSNCMGKVALAGLSTTGAIRGHVHTRHGHQVPL